MLYIFIEQENNMNNIMLSNFECDSDEFESNHIALPASKDIIKANTQATTLRNILYNAGLKDIQLDLIG